jgi:outer membrane lipoprotein carrier protein
MTRFLTFVVTALLMHGAQAESVGDVLWDKLGAIHAMKASFTQRMYSKKRELSKSSGEMAFERPGHFRWQTKEPMAQILVADGTKVWLYDVLLEQVTVKPQTETMGAAAGLFLNDDKARFVHDFEVEQQEKNKQLIFDLHARSKQANIQRMTLRFKQDALASMDLYDQLGQRTVVAFEEVNINPTLSENLFRFTPPPGVDVVEQ